MKKKIIVIFVCTLMIATALSATGSMNFQTTKLVNENNFSEPYQSSTVNPDIITIKIVAKVTYIYDEYNILGGAIKVNDTITGKYIYDSGTPDSDPNQKIGLYEYTSSTFGMELKTGEFVFKTNPSNVDFAIYIYNDYNTEMGELDRYIVDSSNNLQLSNGMLVDLIDLDFHDFTCTALSSAALPTTAPVLSDWEITPISIYGSHPSNPYIFIIQSNVTKATKSRARDIHFTTQPVLIWILERFQNIFPMLRHLMKL